MKIRTTILCLILTLSQVSFTNAQFSLVDTAIALSDSCFRLTGNTQWTSGAAWNRDAVDLGVDFEINLEMNFGIKDANGADGMMLVFHTDTNAIGAQGAGIGAQGIAPSVIVEFDTWMNINYNDPAFDHTAILINGGVDHNSGNTLFGPFQTSPISQNVEDGLWHRVRVTWNYLTPTSQELRVYFDGCLRSIGTSNFINNVFSGTTNVYWGVTASTGGESNIHEFCVIANSVAIDTVKATICAGQSYNVGGTQVSTSGIYYDTVSNIYGCDSLVITNLTVIDTTVITNSLTICTGDSTFFNGQYISNPGTYSYTFSGPGSCDTTELLTLTLSDTLYFTQAIDICEGEFYTLPNQVMVDSTAVYVTSIKSTFGCDSIVTTNLTVNPLPTAIVEDDTICVNQLTEISINTDGNNNVFWSNGGIGSAIEVSIDQPEVLYVQVINGDGCDIRDTMELSTKGFSITAYSNDTTIQPGELAQLYVVGGNNNTLFQWEPTTTLNNPNIRKPIAGPLQTTTYTVTSLAENGCLAIDSITIEVTANKRLNIPTAFSPNQDGINDVFRPYLSADLQLQSLLVFNRWGRKVFDYPHGSGSPQWDGYFDGKLQPMGGYVYLVEVVGVIDGVVQTDWGSLTLVR